MALLAMVSATAFLTGCATSSSRIADAGAVKADASMVGQAIASQAALPDYPAPCRQTERAGIQRGESRDDVITRYDHALGRANSKLASCASWYDEIQHGRAAAAERIFKK